MSPERARELLAAERERIERSLADLEAANGGPLSREGVGELLAFLLALTKRELAR